jgi:dTDP-glucose pyrophosphorylase
MNLLIPMAGGGSRFAEKFFSLPKPLIPVDGMPMVIQAIRCMPEARKQIFIAQREHEVRFNFKVVLESFLSCSNWIYSDGLTQGQAETCLLAKTLINNEDSLFIGACDNGMIYNYEAFNELSMIADAIVFTFRNSAAVAAKPQAYGWVVADGNQARSVSVKVPISQYPVKDPAIVGAFWFRHGKDFVAAAESMIDQNRRVNNEFYVDECINDLIQAGADVRIFDIEHYIGWGTPEDYYTYQYWSSFFNSLIERNE